MTVVGRSPLKMFFPLIGTIAMTLACMMPAIHDDRLYVIILGAAGAVIFGLVSLAISYAILNIILFRSRPGLVLDEKGLFSHALFGCALTYEWSDMIGIGEFSTNGQTSVTLLLRNPDHYLAQMDPVTRFIAKSGIRQCGTPVSISAKHLMVTHRELYELIGAYHRKYRRKKPDTRQT